MTLKLEELRMILEYFGAFGLGALVACAVGFLLLRFFLPSYLSEKAKNLATKEDIGLITDQIEKVKAQYTENLQNLIHQNNLLIEEARGKQQLRLAAIDRRLHAHQEAFALWRKLLSSVHNDSIGQVVLECQEWWNNNCLYLGPEARASFNTAYRCAFNHRDFLQDRTNPELVKSNWKDIVHAGDVIVRDAELPSLGEKESEIIPNNNG
jgi:hypothetical protein